MACLVLVLGADPFLVLFASRVLLAILWGWWAPISSEQLALKTFLAKLLLGSNPTTG